MNLNKLSIQELLSLGYIYLLVLGVFTDTIYYSFFGLHIIAHSDVLDILLSPIAILTENLIIPIFIILGCLLTYFIRIKVSPKLHAKKRLKESYRKNRDIEKLDELYSKKPAFTELVPTFALVIFCSFIGLRVGSGGKLKQRMVEKTFSYKTVITFQNSEQVNTAIIGQNSLYVFYVEEGEDKLTIAPISQNIKLISEREVTEKIENSETPIIQSAPIYKENNGKDSTNNSAK